MTESREARALAATFSTGDPAHKMLHGLADEIDELRAELAENEALRKKMGGIPTPMTGAEYQRMIENGKVWQLIDAQTLRDGGPPEREPADTDILALAHRMAWRYTHSTQPSNIEYTFNNMTLLDFVRALKGLK